MPSLTPTNTRSVSYSQGARLLAMARPTYGCVINGCSPGNPGIVFVPTKKQAQLTAIDLMTFAGADGRKSEFLHAGPDSGEVCSCVYA